MGRAKLETFEKRQTSWEGLWWHSEYNGFSSACIDLSELRKFKGKVRLYVRKNKFFNNGENGRPNYHFCLKDAQADVFHILEVEDEDPSKEDEIGEKISRLAELMREGNRNADQLMLASDSRERAGDLMSQAIRVIEDLTGEKWEFTWISY